MPNLKQSEDSMVRGNTSLWTVTKFANFAGTSLYLEKWIQ